MSNIIWISFWPRLIQTHCQCCVTWKGIEKGQQHPTTPKKILTCFLPKTVFCFSCHLPPLAWVVPLRHGGWRCPWSCFSCLRQVMHLHGNRPWDKSDSNWFSMICIFSHSWCWKNVFYMLCVCSQGCIAQKLGRPLEWSMPGSEQDEDCCLVWVDFVFYVCVCFPLGLEIWYLKRQLDMIQGFGRLCGSLSRPRPWEKECAVSCAYDFVVRILASTSLLRLLSQVKEWVSFGCSLMKRLFCDICISVVRCLGR